jgi:two-component system, probable response regulator PhcQ
VKSLVLLVDDDPNLLRGLCRRLRHEPFELLTARSAEEALGIVRRWPIGLVVSDENMPGMAGTQFCKWIAQHCADIVRIVLTGNLSKETAQRALEEGEVYRFFTKPCDVLELASAIRQGLAERESLQLCTTISEEQI